MGLFVCLVAKSNVILIVTSSFMVVSLRMSMTWGTMRCYSTAVYDMSYGWIVHLHDKCDRITLDMRIWKNTEKCIGI